MKMILRSLGLLVLLTLAALASRCTRKSTAPLTNMQMTHDTAPAAAAPLPPVDARPGAVPAAPALNPNDDIKAGAVPPQPDAPIQTPAITGTVTAPN